MASNRIGQINEEVQKELSSLRRKNMQEKHSLVGERVAGKYKILNCYAQHWYADEYLCIDEAQNKVWTILAYQKMNFPEQLIQKLIEDVGRLQVMNHRALPEVEAIIEEERFLYVVREYIQGTCLMTRTEKTGPCLDIATLEQFAQELCSCLEYLDSLEPPIVLTNLKATNIWIDPSGAVMLSALDEPRYSADNALPERYLPGFAAPEVLTVENDRRMDIFSVGAVLSYLMTGEIDLVKYGKIPEQVNPFWCGTELNYVVAQCLRIRPEDRIQDYDELLWCLRVKEDPPARIAKSMEYRLGRLRRKYRSTPVIGKILGIMAYYRHVKNQTKIKGRKTKRAIVYSVGKK